MRFSSKMLVIVDELVLLTDILYSVYYKIIYLYIKKQLN